MEDANPPNLSPDHHFGNDFEIDECDHDTYHKNGPFYFFNSDEDLGVEEVIYEKDSLFNMQFPCKIGYRSFDAYLNSSLPINIISRANYNKIMVKELENLGDNIVARVEPLHVFVGSFVYLVDFMVMEDLGEFIDDKLTQVIFGKPFKRLTKQDERLMDGLITFSDGDEDFVYQMPHSHPMFKKFTIEACNRSAPISLLSENDKRNGLSYSHEKNKRYYKGCLELNDEYKKDDATIKWLTYEYVRIDDNR